MATFASGTRKRESVSPLLLMVAYVPNTMLNTGQGQRRKNNMNADELADLIEFDAPIMGLNKEAATMLRQLQAENEALKAFVKPIIAHGDDCIGNWDGDELQDLAVKTGLLIEVEKTQFCNLDKEEFIGCPCREYHYDEESWVCLNTAKFLLDEAQEK